MASVNSLVDPVTGRKYPVGGCIISDKPSDAPKYGAMRTLKNSQLPPAVDLRQFTTPIEDQQSSNSCVGNALAGAYEFLIMRNSRKHVDVSRLFIYYNSRLIDGMQPHAMRDGGTQINSAVKGLAHYGCCKENIFPFNMSYINSQPPKQCYNKAKNFRIAQSMSIDVNLDEMKACLADGYPFVFGLELCQSFMNAGSNYGRVQTPSPYEQQAAQHGWHAMLAVGYSDPSKCFIVRNSWGPNWGDKGNCYIPYDYMTNRQRCRDLHAIKVVTQEPPRGIDGNVNNQYVWNIHTNVDNAIPKNYPYQYFPPEFFWQYQNLFNYYKHLYYNGQVVPFVFKNGPSPSENAAKPEKITDSKKKIVLWIDTNHVGNKFIADKLSSDKSIQIEFRDTMKKAEEYLETNKQLLQSLPSFQIISRGFYKDENKNPLDLWEFILSKRFHNAVIFVYTQDKKGVEWHLEKQASTLHISDWRKNITVCEDGSDLIQKMTRN